MHDYPEQIRQAALNHYRKPVTSGARIRAALEHARASNAYYALARFAQVLTSVQPT